MGHLASKSNLKASFLAAHSMGIGLALDLQAKSRKRQSCQVFNDLLSWNFSGREESRSKISVSSKM